jgi:hypothetical protein
MIEEVKEPPLPLAPADTPLFPEPLPVYKSDLEKAVSKKPEEKINILQEQLLDLMNERNVSLSQIQKETGIPWGTLMEWHGGTVNSQKADKNLLRLAQFFNVTIDYLCFGIGEDSPYYDKNKDASA